MHAIVRCGNNQYYVSTVFGYYCNVTATDDYQRYLEGIHNRYFLVLNREKTNLIKKYIYPKDNKYLDPLVLIIEGNTDDWIVDKEDNGCVDFLAELNQDTIEKNLPKEFLKRCIQIDAEYCYNEYPEIHGQNDIDDLMDASGGFHDACIEKYDEQDNGSLYVLFKDIWGCKIEMWFEGNVSYSVTSRNPEDSDPYWQCASMFIKDGFIYFVDEEDMSVSDIGDGYCWFKSRNLKYHIIPNP